MGGVCRPCRLAHISGWTHTSPPSLCPCLHWGDRDLRCAWGPWRGEGGQPSAKVCALAAPAAGALPGRGCGWVESTGVRQRGQNVPRMLGAAYLRPGMRRSILSHRPSRLWDNHPGGMAAVCPVRPAQTVCRGLCQATRGWGSRVCLCVCVCV